MKDPMNMQKEDWKSILKADPTDWLLDRGNIVIRYRALKEIIGAVRRALPRSSRKKGWRFCLGAYL